MNNLSVPATNCWDRWDC